MTGEQMWAEFAAGYHIKDAGCEAWAFGGDADELARAGRAFDEDVPVVCEEFRRVWPE